ncbi:MAG: hypothetical protein HY263_03725 [Chloroflexi bacterium]|nr:hypothetical protein [Chloroflexota bacterium]
MIWSDEARRELPLRASGRRLLLDYFATRCCGRNVNVGDVDLRWARSSDSIAEDFLPLPAPPGVDAYIQRDLVAVLEAAGARIVMRGWSRLRRPSIELADGAAWLDFVGSCRTRSLPR